MVVAMENSLKDHKKKGVITGMKIVGIWWP
jgi:hypothetical protein